MKLTHIDEKGKANMVDVAGKPQQTRTAVAEGFIHLQTDAMRTLTGFDLNSRVVD